MRVLTSKKCTSCRRVLPIAEFRPNHRYSDGYAYACKPCIYKAERKRALANIKEVQEYQRKYQIAWRAANKGYWNDWYAKNVARKSKVK